VQKQAKTFLSVKIIERFVGRGTKILSVPDAGYLRYATDTVKLQNRKTQKLLRVNNVEYSNHIRKSCQAPAKTIYLLFFLLCAEAFLFFLLYQERCRHIRHDYKRRDGGK